VVVHDLEWEEMAVLVDMVLTNCNLVIPSIGVVRAGVAIDDGLIASIASYANLPKAERVLDVQGNYVLPGVIDPHVHYGNSYGRYSLDFKENVGSESISAAMGGVTTVNVMQRIFPSSRSYFDFFEENVPEAQRKASTNFLLTIGILTDVHVEEMVGYAEKLGVLSFKFFRGYKGREGAGLGATGLDDGTFYGMLRKISQLGDNALACVHCENAEIIRYTTDQTRAQGGADLTRWSEARPDLAEVESIRSAIYLACDATMTRLYIPHVSSAAGIDAVANAKTAGKTFFAETCPHYLTLTKNDREIGIRGKVNPPLRDRQSVEKLWDRVIDGTIDTIGSDHIPVRLKDKLADGDIWSAGLGFPGSGTMLPILLHEGFHRRGVGLRRIAELVSYNSARALGLYPRKGAIAPGSDADLTIVNLKKEAKVSSELLQSAAGFTLYEGWTLKGWPVTTMLGGSVIMEDGEFVGRPGQGKYVRRSVSQENNRYGEG
jgi:dihydropyrimidinase